MTVSATDVLPHAEKTWALFLDFDGTLADIAETPEAVHVEQGLLDILLRLRRELDGAVAIVSGRPIVQIDAFLAPLCLPTAGLHGLERRRGDGTVTRVGGPADTIDGVRDRLAAFAAGRPGVMVEDKGLTVALHYRGAPELAAVCRREVRSAVAGLPGVHVLEGKMVLEVKPSGVDKGHAIENFMAEVPFLGRRPVFIGDDVTDEYGFAMVERHGGISIRVGDGAPTQARYRIADSARLRAWLGRVSRELEAAEA